MRRGFGRTVDLKIELIRAAHHRMSEPVRRRRIFKRHEEIFGFLRFEEFRTVCNDIIYNRRIGDVLGKIQQRQALIE